MNYKGTKRESDDIEKEVLECIILNKITKKTKVMQHCNTTSEKIIILFNKFRNKGYISGININKQSCNWKITKKGLDRYVKFRLAEIIKNE
jgi:predicted transcriptional regulator